MGQALTTDVAVNFEEFIARVCVDNKLRRDDCYIFRRYLDGVQGNMISDFDWQGLVLSSFSQFVRELKK